MPNLPDKFVFFNARKVWVRFFWAFYYLSVGYAWVPTDAYANKYKHNFLSITNFMYFRFYSILLVFDRKKDISEHSIRFHVWFAFIVFFSHSHTYVCKCIIPHRKGSEVSVTFDFA